MGDAITEIILAVGFVRLVELWCEVRRERLRRQGETHAMVHAAFSRAAAQVLGGLVPGGGVESGPKLTPAIVAPELLRIEPLEPPDGWVTVIQAATRWDN